MTEEELGAIGGVTSLEQAYDFALRQFEIMALVTGCAIQTDERIPATTRHGATAQRLNDSAVTVAEDLFRTGFEVFKGSVALASDAEYSAFCDARLAARNLPPIKER